MGKGQWDAWQGVGELRQRMDRLLEEALRDMAQADPAGAPYFWAPLADVYETQLALVIRLDVPGVPVELMALEWADGELLVRGERPAEKPLPLELDDPVESAEPTFLLMERAHGAFVRRFPLPQDADPDGITAALQDGVLTIVVPRSTRKPCCPRRVDIG